MWFYPTLPLLYCLCRSFYRAALSKVLQPPLPSPGLTVSGHLERGGEREREWSQMNKSTVVGNQEEGGGGGRKEQGRRGEGREGSQEEMPAVAGELMAMMSGDWEKTVVETEVFWLALHLARYTHDTPNKL